MTVLPRARLAFGAMAMAMAIVIAIAGCAGSSTRSAPTVVGSTAVDGVPDALQFTAPLVGGGRFDAAALAGRPVVFWFWAPT